MSLMWIVRTLPSPLPAEGRTEAAVAWGDVPGQEAGERRAVDGGVPAAEGAAAAALAGIAERHVPELAGGPGRARDRTAGFDDGPADAVRDVQVQHRAGSEAGGAPRLGDAGQGRVVANDELAARLVVLPQPRQVHPVPGKPGSEHQPAAGHRARHGHCRCPHPRAEPAAYPL